MPSPLESCAFAGELRHALNELKVTKADVAAQTAQYDQFISSLPRLERRVELLTKERDSLKQILTMYQDEVPKAVTPGDYPHCKFQTRI